MSSRRLGIYISLVIYWLIVPQKSEFKASNDLRYPVLKVDNSPVIALLVT